MPRRRRLSSIAVMMCRAASPAPFGPGAHPAVHLGRDDDLVAAGEVGERAAGDLLARAVGVHVGGVEGGDARLERLADERAAGSSSSGPARGCPVGLAVSSCSRGPRERSEGRCSPAERCRSCRVHQSICPIGSRFSAWNWSSVRPRAQYPESESDSRGASCCFRKARDLLDRAALAVREDLRVALPPTAGRRGLRAARRRSASRDDREAGRRLGEEAVGGVGDREDHMPREAGSMASTADEIAGRAVWSPMSRCHGAAESAGSRRRRR